MALACQVPQEPEFVGLRDVRIAGPGLAGNLVLTAEAVFGNPNSFGVDVTDLEMDVFVDRRQAAHIRQTLGATMHASSPFTVPVEIDIPLAILYEDAGDLVGRLLSGRQIHVRLEGWLQVKSLGFQLRVPLSHEGTYGVGR